METNRTWDGITAAISRAWRLLCATFWFLPAILILAAFLIAPILVQFDEWLQATGRSIEWLGWIYGGGLQGARRLLSAIAAAMMAISTVTFSSQTTALTFIGQEYGSRLLRNFLADARNQVAFGTYMSTFVYALMVLRTIHKDPDDAPVPHLALSFGIIMAMGSLGVLVYSMYHISRFLQASTIIAYAANDLEATITRLTDDPDFSGRSPDRARDSKPEERNQLGEADLPGHPILAATSGYLQNVKERRLLRLCRRAGCFVRIDPRVGDFVVAGTVLAIVSGAPPPGAALIRRIAGAIVLASEPGIEQDLRYAVNQFVQIALRAASTDRNDTLTATMCVDRMTSALCLLARRLPPRRVRYDAAGVPRLMLEGAGFADAVDTFVRPLREVKEQSPSLLSHVLDMLGVVAACALREEDREVLRREAGLIAEAGPDRPDGSWGRERIARAYSHVRKTLDDSPGSHDAENVPRRT